jgi:hypothetical protein
MHRNSEPRRFGVILHEGSGVISFQYTGLGFPAGGDAAVGVQEAGTEGKFKQYSCGSNSLVSGQRIDFIPDPRNLVPPVISGEAVEGRALSAGTGTWDGTEPISFSQAWKRCDPDGTNCTFIPGSSAATYTLTAMDVNRTLRAVVFAATQEGDDFVESAPSALVQAAPAGSGTGQLPGGGSGTGQQPDGSGTIALAAISNLTVRPVAFPPARRGGSVAARRRGTTVRFTLNRDTVVRFTVQRALPGRRSRAGRCVAPRRAPSGKPCTRWRRRRGAFSVEGTAGANAFRFTGRLRGRALPLGRYRLVARPGEGARKRAPFRITR